MLCDLLQVGGDMSATVIEKFMNRKGRISCCGALSAYNATAPPIGNLVIFVFKFCRPN